MKPTIHLICNAHLDPVWQWRWEEGASEAIATFRTAAEILREHEGLIFNHNEAVLYRWVRQYDPRLFSEIQSLVKEGRWHISGGWFLQPDVNIPGIESTIRHIAEGRRFFEKEFGARPIVAYNFDSFGHGAGLPQVLRRAGYEMYLHMRPQANELKLPSDLYRWRGSDGSEILTLRIAVGLYHTERDNILDRLKEGTNLALSINRDVPVFWGIGNHGGGPTREDLRRIDDFVKTEQRVSIVHSTPELLYESLKPYAAAAPIVEGDLQRCFTGTYTSLSRLKRRCHESLGTLIQTEALRTMTWWVADQAYPEHELDEAWLDHLFNDFHDILPGSCTQPAEQDALDQYGKVAETCRRLRLGAAAVLNRGPRRKDYIPVTVLNTNPGLQRVPVDVDCMLDLRPKWTGTWHLRLKDDNGKEVPIQEEQPESLLPFNGWRRRVSFVASVPSVGVRNYTLNIAEGAPARHAALPALHHAWNPTTGLIHSLDAGGQRETLSGPLLRPIVVDDDGDAWGSDRWSYDKLVGTFHRISGPTVVQTGPIRSITESVLTFGQSRIVYSVYAYPGWPVLEFRLRITWNEPHRRLKLSIPTRFLSAQVLCDVPGGVISRPANGQEHMHGRWIMLDGVAAGVPTSLAVVSSGLHGFDAGEGEIRLSVLRSAAYCHEQGFQLGHTPERKLMDIGTHDVRLLVTAGDTNIVRNSLAGLVDYLSTPPIVYAHLPAGSFDEPTSEQLPAARDLLRITPANVRLLACKRSFDGEALILRVQETIGKPTDMAIQVNHPSASIQLKLNPYAITTLRLERSGSWREVPMIDES